MRSTVFALAGILVIEAAVTYQPSKAGGIDKALLTLRNQPFGEFLLILAALGPADSSGGSTLNDLSCTPRCTSAAYPRHGRR